MEIRVLHTAEELRLYDAWVKTHPQGSLWQSLSWKSFQEARGREVRIYAALDDDAIRASALVVIDRTTGGWSTWDVPRGPLGVTSNELPVTSTLLQTIVHDAQKDKCLSVYMSPSTHVLETGNWKLETSHRHEQPEATRILDLTLSEEDLLKQMHQKGRYNIKVAQKNGVIIKRSAAADAEAFAHLAQETAKRDGFRALSAKHYRAFLEEVEGSFLLFAYANKVVSHEWRVMSDDTQNSKLKTQNSPIAALIGTIWNGTGTYYYGASDYAHRALMAPYLLQWEAMKMCKEAGCERYDLLGITPIRVMSHESRVMSDQTQNSSHPWAGVSAFKEKFGGTVVSYPPEQEIVLRPVMKKLLGWKRRFI